VCRALSVRGLGGFGQAMDALQRVLQDADAASWSDDDASWERARDAAIARSLALHALDDPDTALRTLDIAAAGLPDAVLLPRYRAVLACGVLE
jgi:hypothetical protein